MSDKNTISAGTTANPRLIGLLAGKLRQNGEFRRTKQYEHPDDARNAKAAAASDLLADELEKGDFSPELGRRYSERHCDERGATSVSEVEAGLIDGIGFRYHFGDADAFLNVILTASDHEAFLEGGE